VSNASSFSRLPDGGAAVTITFAGEPVTARAGDSVAAALLAAGHCLTRRTPVSGAGRGAFCMMGVCFECLVEIDGEANRQGCMVEVREGLSVVPMSGARPLDPADADDRGDDRGDD
jgi:predicted molibdopterin-dependent oxidoreductase YjgC